VRRTCYIWGMKSGFPLFLFPSEELSPWLLIIPPISKLLDAEFKGSCGLYPSSSSEVNRISVKWSLLGLGQVSRGTGTRTLLVPPLAPLKRTKDQIKEPSKARLQAAKSHSR